MVKNTKRKLFYLLALVFLIALPILLSFSLGYTFNFSSRSVEKTGGIFIKSRIPRLSIFLNNDFLKDTSFISGGALLTGINPGTYLLRIEKSGYHAWSKAVIVEVEVVTELRNILLAQNPVEISTSTQQEITSLAATSTPAVRVSLDKKQNLILTDIKKVIASDIHSFGMADGKILMVGNQGFLSRFDPAADSIEILGRPGFYLSGKKAQFVSSPTGEVVILDSGGGIYLIGNGDEITTFNGGAEKVAFDEDGEKLLIKKETSVEMLWMHENRYQPFQKKWAREEILKSEEPIIEAQWFFGDNAHIVIQTKDGLFLTEVDGRGGRNTVELFSGKTDEILTSPSASDAVFFRQGKIWHKIEL